VSVLGFRQAPSGRPLHRRDCCYGDCGRLAHFEPHGAGSELLGSQSPVFQITGSSKDYFLEPVGQTNVNLCTDPISVSLYRQNETVPVYSGQVTYYLTRSGSNSGCQVNWNSMFLPDGVASGNYYFQVQEPSCRTGVTLALLRIAR
jgi:hypothetical protein